MKKNQYLIILLILFCACALSAQTKRRNFKGVGKQIVTKKQKKPAALIVFGGVMNAKAVYLAKPPYPPAARAANVRGTVKVSILIDENGIVSESRADSGHPLLKAVSVAAARNSIFTPTTIGGNPAKVRGVIIYNYISDEFNWLEIGSGVSGGRFLAMLPAGFEEEKQLYEQSRSAERDDRVFMMRSLKVSIENKLGDNPKNLWLFRVGLFLTDLQLNCCAEQELSESISNLKILLSNVPDKVSPALIKKLERLAWLSENAQSDADGTLFGDRIYRQLEDIFEKSPLLGN